MGVLECLAGFFVPLHFGFLVLVPPAYAVLVAGGDDPAIRVVLLEGIPVLLGDLVPDAAYGGQVGHIPLFQGGQPFRGLGVADVQHLQALAVLQRAQVCDIAAVGDFQDPQVLARGQGAQVLDGGAGNDQHLQALHAGEEGRVVQILVVAEIGVFHILQILELGAVAVLQVIDAADYLRIRQAGAVSEIDPPDHLGPVPIVLPELDQHIAAQSAVLQHEALAVGQQVQGQPDLLLAAVADALLFQDHLFHVRGQGLPVKVEGVVEDGLGGGGNDLLGLLLGKSAVPVFIAELYGLQVRQLPQLGGGLLQSVPRQRRQVQLLGGAFVLPAQNIHGVGEVDVREGLLEALELFQGQGHFGEGHGFHLMQKQQPLLQGVQVKGALAQLQLRSVRQSHRGPQADGVADGHIGQRLLELLQSRVVIAGRGIDDLQLREIGLQQPDII